MNHHYSYNTPPSTTPAHFFTMSLASSLFKSVSHLNPGLSSSLRPAAALLQEPTGARFASKKSADAGTSSKATSKQIAAQRERNLAQQQIKRREQKKMSRLRLEAKTCLNTPLHLDTLTALRYLRAAEVGQPGDTTTITMNVRVVAERGVQPLFGSIKFPKSLDSDQRIAVFTLNPELAEEAKAAGAAVVGGEELIDEVRNGNINFNKALATPDILSKLSSVARVLGPKGLMPSPRRGTVSNNIVDLVSRSVGVVDFRQGGVPFVSVPVAKVSFTDAEIVKNLIAAIDEVRAAANRAVSKKPVVLGQTTISSTRGPGIVIDV